MTVVWLLLVPESQRIAFSSTTASTECSGPLVEGECHLIGPEGSISVGEPIQRGSGILDVVKFLSVSRRSLQHLHVLSQGACVAMMEVYNASVISDDNSDKLKAEEALKELLDKYAELTKETSEGPVQTWC